MTEHRRFDLWAWVAENADGNESLLVDEYGFWMIDPNVNTLLDLRHVAEKMAAGLGLHPEMAKLVRFVREG